MVVRKMLIMVAFGHYPINKNNIPLVNIINIILSQRTAVGLSFDHIKWLPLLKIALLLLLKKKFF